MRTRFRTFASLAAAAVALPLHPLAAQDGLFRARVVDASGGAPVPGARASFDRGEGIAVSDSTGRLALAGMPPGSHDVLVERIGYAPLHQRLRVNERDTAEVVLRLVPDATVVQGVTATATPVSDRMQEFEFRRTHAFGSARFITRADLDREPSTTLAELVRRLPGAQIVYDPRTNGAYLASGRVLPPGALMQVAPPCFAQVLVDGTPAFGATNDRRGRGTPLDLNDYHAADLEAVEYYSSPASTPAELRSSTASCGTLVVWTREAH
jgi:hypothetical protein